MLERMDPLATDYVNVDTLWNTLSDAEKSRLLIDNISFIPGLDIETTLFLLPPTVEEVSRAYAKNGRIAWFGRTDDWVFFARVDQDKGDSVLVTDMHLYRRDDLKGLTLGDIAGSVDIRRKGGLDVSEEIIPLGGYEQLLSFDSVDLLTMYTVLKEREEILGLPSGTASRRVKYLFRKTCMIYDNGSDSEVVKMVQLYAHYIMYGNAFEDIPVLINKHTDVNYELEDVADVWFSFRDPDIQEPLERELRILLRNIFVDP